MEIRQAKARQVWSKHDLLSSQYVTPVPQEGALFGIDGRQDAGTCRLRAIDPTSGEVFWTKEDFGMASLMLADEKLVISPLSYIRGRSLQRMYFIIDESQNLTPHEVKTIITRAGEGTKIVLTGDIQQIDQPYLDSLSNGLSHLINRMTGQPLYAHVTLTKGERSDLADLASDLL